jgi:hypothetical protein
MEIVFPSMKLGELADVLPGETEERPEGYAGPNLSPADLRFHRVSRGARRRGAARARGGSHAGGNPRGTPSGLSALNRQMDRLNVLATVRDLERQAS